MDSLPKMIVALALLVLATGVMAQGASSGNMGMLSLGQDYRPNTKRCLIERDRTKLRLTCRNMNLRVVPIRETGIQVLDLMHNSIKEIETGQLSRYRSMETLYLNDNRMFQISKEMVAGMPYLKELHVADNSLAKISPDLFKLPYLKMLDLSANYLNDTALTFNATSHLETLVVDKSKKGYITRLPAIGIQPHLTYLSLMENSIKHVTAEDLARFCSLKKLDLRKNPIQWDPKTCDCHFFNSWVELRGINLMNQTFPCGKSPDWCNLVNYRIKTISTYEKCLQLNLIKVQKAASRNGEDREEGTGKLQGYKNPGTVQVTKEETTNHNTDDAEISCTTMSTVEQHVNSKTIPKTELDKEKVNRGIKIASRMLHYMNHLTDECEDFYEYACGEFEADNLISENDLAKLATQRIFDQHKKSDESPVYNKEFFGYYDSCVDAYTDNSKASYHERIELAKTAIEEVGRFYEYTEWNETYFDLTTMLSKLLQRGSAPLFDITLGVAVDPQESCTDERSQPKFTLKLGPPVIKNSIYVDEKQDKCNKDQSSENLKKSVDLKSLYDQHENCTNKMVDFLDSIEDALEKLGVPENIRMHSRFDIERLSSTLLPKRYQTKKIINEALVTRKYEVMQIAKLQNDTVPESFLNWTLLLEKLTNPAVVSQQSLQVYFSSEIIKGFNNLYRERDEVAGVNQRALHNALLGLYAHKVYQELVAPQRDVENYCKRIATDLMGTHASKLYVSSFSPGELEEMRETAKKTFRELKSALESSLKKATWLKNSDDAVIIKKIRDLELEIPDVSYYQDNSKLDPENSEIQDKLSGNFFKDSMLLLTRSRRLMYGMLHKDPNESAQIWTHFALPYQTSGSAVYELNKVIMPYAAIYWPQVLEANKISSRHLVLATLGTRIANLIADHFGPTGIQFFNRMKSEESAVLCNDPNAAEAYQSYLDRYDGFVNETVGWMQLPNMQNVSYQISSLSRNQRLSDITGLQLAYDAMLALPPDSRQLMPWLNGGRDNNEATQFLVAYAQMHCTKVPLSSSFVRLFEDEHLPSRLRIALVASGSSMFGSTWKCPLGSPIRSGGDPSYSFPQAVSEDPDPDSNSCSSATTSESGTSEPTTTMEWTATTSKNETPAEKLCIATKNAMNPTAHPCEDFYEYACGGFEASNVTTEKDPAEEAIKRIFDQANKDNTRYSDFLKYFNSCMSYEQNTTREQRMNLAMKYVSEVGNFSTARSPDNFNVISMLSKLLLRDSSPLFDIILDFDANKDLGKQHKFVLKMVPPVFKSTLCVDVSETCFAKQMEAMTDNDEYDGSFGDYEDYDGEEDDTKDENNENTKDRLNSENLSNSVMDAIKQFPEFRRYNLDAIKKGVEHVLDDILKLRQVQPRKVTALSKNKPDDLDFEKLVESSMKSSEFKNLKIYSDANFASAIRGILKNGEHSQRLNNGLLGLYVFKIYNEMVLPGRTETYCRRAATSLMQQDAVNLYLSSFPTEERERRNNLTKTMFQKLINTFKTDVRDAAWLGVARAAVENKIDKMSIVLPYLSHNGNKAPEKVSVTLTGNFLDDTVMLQGQNKRAMYQMLGESANQHNIWTYFALPYQTSVSVIYNLNKVVVPYEAVDWSGVLGTSETSLEYLRIATLGTVIAHGIARHFDQTGITYYDLTITKPSNDIFYCKNPCDADSVYRSYIRDHKKRGEEENRIKLPSTGMDLAYTLDDLSLNDRIAEDIGVQLAYRTMQRSSSSSDLLPCLGSDNHLKEKQFFLAYAQMHCTKEPTTTPILLKDGHSLPGRIRIAQLAANDYQFMIGTWNCSDTSSKDGESKLKIFPSVVGKPSIALRNSK